MKTEAEASENLNQHESFLSWGISSGAFVTATEYSLSPVPYIKTPFLPSIGFSQLLNHFIAKY